MKTSVKAFKNPYLPNIESSEVRQVNYFGLTEAQFADHCFITKNKAIKDYS